MQAPRNEYFPRHYTISGEFQIKKIENSPEKENVFIPIYSSPFFLTNGITKTQFVASLMRHQRPNRCSCPMAAINLLPSFVNAKLFTKPGMVTSNSGCSSRYVSLVFHNLIVPSHEPDATKSVLINVAMALIQFAWPFSVDRPCAIVFTHNGFFFMALHRHKELFSMGIEIRENSNIRI